MSRVDDLYTTARRAFARGEAASWEAAEAMAELVERGETQQQIAKRLGCHQSTVARYVAVVRYANGITNRPTFTEAMAQVRDTSQQVYLPKAPERRAELVAKLLKDKAVADAPAVRKVEQAHADRRLRAETAAFNRNHGIPTRNAHERETRRLSVVTNDAFWVRTMAAVQQATRALNEAVSELDRTGLPSAGSGQLVRATRALSRAAERFEQSCTTAGVGRAM